MKLGNPLPQSLPKECAKAAKIFKSFVDSGNNGLDGVIPRSVLENAKGFAIFTVFKAGFVFSARAGSGVVIAKLDDGSWSAPSAIGTAGLGVGGQAGAEMTDFLVVLNSQSATRSFMAAGSLTLGGNMSIALGPLGRNGEATGALSTNGRVAAMYSYSKTRGLFGGISVEGSVIVERQDANVQAYNSPVTARMLLGGTVDQPSWAMPLIKTLEACTGLPGTRTWVQEDVDLTPGGSYAFAGVASPGPGRSTSPSFLKKKKEKVDKPPFPPASWGSSTNSGSYFTDDAPQSHSRNATWDASDSSTANFGTRFDSDFVPEKQPTKPRFSQSLSFKPNGPDNLNPFSSYSPTTRSHNPRSNSMSAMSYSSPSTSSKHSGFPAELQSRGSLISYDEEDVFTPTTRERSGSQPPHFIAPKPELTKPLLPHEGIARAIALYDFKAVEPGDLSFSKGQVITVTKKSDSSDDWWTGKVETRTGIFPANFVEVV